VLYGRAGESRCRAHDQGKRRNEHAESVDGDQQNVQDSMVEHERTILAPVVTL